MNEEQDETPHPDEPLPVHEQIRLSHERLLKGIGVGLLASGAGSALGMWLQALNAGPLPDLKWAIYHSSIGGFFGNVIGIPLALVVGVRAFRQPQWEWWWRGIVMCAVWGLFGALFTF